MTNANGVNKQSGRRNRKERKNLIRKMDVELRKKGNCVSQYNTVTDKEHINVISNLCKSKRAFTSFEESRVCHLVYIGVSFDHKQRSAISVSPAVNYCHYACGSTKVTVRSTHLMYRYSPSLPTIYNYHPSALIISILPQNVIAVQQK